MLRVFWFCFMSACVFLHSCVCVFIYCIICLILFASVVPDNILIWNIAFLVKVIYSILPKEWSWSFQIIYNSLSLKGNWILVDLLNPTIFSHWVFKRVYERKERKKEGEREGKKEEKNERRKRGGLVCEFKFRQTLKKHLLFL